MEKSRQQVIETMAASMSARFWLQYKVPRPPPQLTRCLAACLVKSPASTFATELHHSNIKIISEHDLKHMLFYLIEILFYIYNNIYWISAHSHINGKQILPINTNIIVH